MSEDDLKVTDKRMFTPDGELRTDLAAGSVTAPVETETPEPAAASREESRHDGEVAAKGPVVSGPEVAGPRTEYPKPEFLDLVGVLAEPIPLFLGDVEMPEGGSAENLELARFYIDLLEVLGDKTRGNLNPQESQAVEGLLYQLRMRFIQKKG